MESVETPCRTPSVSPSSPQSLGDQGSRRANTVARRTCRRGEHPIDAHTPGAVACDEARTPPLPVPGTGQIGQGRGDVEPSDAAGSIAAVEPPTREEHGFPIHLIALNIVTRAWV